MDKLSFNIFPNVNFIDLCMYQFGHEQCEPGHSFGPATRNHYLFHYVLSGTGTLMADNAKGITQTYNIKSGQGFLIFPGQINTYIADDKLPWEYIWIEFDGLRVKEALTTTELTKNNPVYHTHSKDIREKLVEEMLYITKHPAPLRFSFRKSRPERSLFSPESPSLASSAIGRPPRLMSLSWRIACRASENGTVTNE